MVINPNINDYDVKVLILLGNQTDNTFKRYQIKLAIINKLFDMERPMFFYINQFIISKGILKEVYAEMITMRMKHYDYYIEEEYLQKNFRILEKIKHEGYYVKMAVAWAISICLIKFYDKTVEYLKKCNLDKWTYNKAIQKAIESYRITNEQKDFLRKMKNCI